MNLRVINITKEFNIAGTHVLAVDNISMDINDGDFISLVGATGSGKTTFLSLIGGIMKPSGGSVYYDTQKLNGLKDEDIAELRKRYVSFIFQYPELISDLTVLENILMPLMFKRRITEEIEERAYHYLERLSLAHKAELTPLSLSGGEQKKVAVVRAIMYEPELLLADEPTSDLDPDSADEVMTIFREINEQHRISIVMVTHARGLASEAKNIYKLNNGKIVDLLQ